MHPKIKNFWEKRFNAQIYCHPSNSGSNFCLYYNISDDKGNHFTAACEVSTLALPPDKSESKMYYHYCDEWISENDMLRLIEIESFV